MNANKNKWATLLSLCVLVALIGTIVATSLSAGGMSQDASQAQVARWQYASLKIPAGTSDKDLGKQILKLGDGGWELVSVQNFLKEGTTTETAFYFKRPKKIPTGGITQPHEPCFGAHAGSCVGFATRLSLPSRFFRAARSISFPRGQRSGDTTTAGDFLLPSY